MSTVSEVVFIVREVAEGWIVEDGTTNGPFFSKMRAVELAEGMASAVRDAGSQARVVVS